MSEKTSLLQALAGGPSRPARMCRVGLILVRVDPDTRSALTAALADADWPTARIAHLISLHVEPTSRPTVADHRARACGCYR